MQGDRLYFGKSEGATVLGAYYVATMWLEAKTDARFEKWIETQRFTHPETRNKVKFKSLPQPEQDKIRQRYQQSQQQEDGGRREREPERVREKSWGEKYNDRAFAEWLGDADEKTLSRWQEGDRKTRKKMREEWQQNTDGPKTTGERLKAQNRERREAFAQRTASRIAQVAGVAIFSLARQFVTPHQLGGIRLGTGQAHLRQRRRDGYAACPV